MKLIAIGSAIVLFTLPAWAGTFLEDFDNNFGVWQELIFNDVMNDAPPGSWEIVDRELHAVSPDGRLRLLTVGDETWRDYTIEFDVKPLKKPGPAGIVIAARINGDWVAWCVIGEWPFIDNVSRIKCAAGNFRDPTPLFFFGSKHHRPLKLKEWSKLKLGVEEDILNLWINGKHVFGPIQLPDRQSFQNLDAGRKRHHEEHHADEKAAIFQPMRLGQFQDFLTGGAGFGLANQTARFDNVVITGDSIPDRQAFSVTPKAKLATVWGSLKRL